MSLAQFQKKVGIVLGQLALVLAVLVTATANAAAAEDPRTPAYLTQWLQQPSLQFGDIPVATPTLRSFYAARGYQPVWVDANGLTPRAQQALAVIAKADTEGLNSELYAIGTIHNVGSMPLSDADQAMRVRLSLELLMSNAVLHYMSDIEGGVARHQWDTGTEKPTQAGQVAMLQQAAASNDAALFLAQQAPQSKEYSALKTVLQHYRQIAANGGWAHFLPGKPLKPGMNDPRVATMRQILGVTGDLAAADATTTQPALYDVKLAEAVKQFQIRHGIEPDGVAGTSTQNALAVPADARVDQIEVTLERMRWMPHDLGSRYVLVNIPSYTLTAVSGSNRMSMNVIVGKPSTQTPMFSKEITDVIFNPSWGVPSKIATKELLPKILKNPNYLANAGYTVVENTGGSSHVIDPSEIDWQSAANGHYSFRQNPGDGNALGKVKFNIPDSDDIYLHDTSQRGLFARADRSLSHGCIRLGDPKALAEFVMNNEGWNMDKIDATYESSTPRTVHIAPLPVHLVYWTSWVDSSGRAHFGRDIYGMDKKLLTAMSAPKREDSIKLAMN